MSNDELAKALWTAQLARALKNTPDEPLRDIAEKLDTADVLRLAAAMLELLLPSDKSPTLH